MRKSFIILLLVFFVLMLSACSSDDGKDYVFTNEVVSKNLPESEPSKIKDTTIYQISFPITYTVDKTYFNNAGLLIVQDDVNRKSCWSIIKNDYLFPFTENIAITVLTVGFSASKAHYIKTTTNEDIVTVYDCFGNVVVSPDKYVQVEITGGEKSLYLNNDDKVSNVYVETIKTLKQSDFDDGITFPSTTQYIINTENGSRQALTIPTSGFFLDPFGNKLDLKDFGLDGYFGKLFKSYLYILDSDDNVVNMINLNGVYPYGIISGNLIYQKLYEVDLESNDFTYLHDGKKYLLSSYSLDLKTGKQKQLELEYLIENFSIFKDENDEYKYGYVKVKQIENKNLLEDECYCLINVNGKIVADSGPFNLLRLRKLGNNHFYDPELGYILNDKFEPLYYIGYSINFSPNKNLIILKKDNYYGAINYDGEIVIPFEYTYLEADFYFGNVLGTNIDGKLYLVSETYKKYIGSKLYTITPGLLFRSEYNSEKELYEVIISDYNSVAKANIETSIAVSHTFAQFTNIYGTYLTKEFPNDEGNIYVSIDVSYKDVDTGN